jgi:hypothetical protein
VARERCLRHLLQLSVFTGKARCNLRPSSLRHGVLSGLPPKREPKTLKWRETTATQAATATRIGKKQSCCSCRCTMETTARLPPSCIKASTAKVKESVRRSGNGPGDSYCHSISLPIQPCAHFTYVQSHGRLHRRLRHVGPPRVFRRRRHLKGDYDHFLATENTQKDPPSTDGGKTEF